MKKQILFAIALFFALALVTNVNAFTISIADSFTANHNSHLYIPITLANSDTFTLYNATISATNILSGSVMTTTPTSNRTINGSSTASYTLDYSIPQYTYKGIYISNITLSAQDINGTLYYASKNVSINVNENKGLSASATTVTVTAVLGATTQTSFAITNTGNVNLTNIAVTQQSTLNDSDGNIVTLSITSDRSLQSLKPGETATIYISAAVPNDQQRKTYSSNLLVNSTEGIGATVAYQIGIKENYCELGNRGSYFTITIKDPNDGEDFYPNSDIPAMVRVKNNNDDDRDVVVVADLYDETDDNFLDIEYSTDTTIDGDSSEDIEFILKVPLDVSNTHEYKLFAKIYEDGNEEEQCKEEYISIDIKKDSHSIIFDKVEMLSTVACDGSFDVKAKLANAGKNDEEDVKVQVINSELGISEEKLVNIDSGESRTVAVPIKIQKNTVEKDYTFTIRANYYLSNDEYRKDVQVVKTVKVQGNCLLIIEDTVLNAEVLSDAFAKEQFGIKLTVFNTGSSAATYNIIVSDYDKWARLDKVEPATITVEAGKSGASYVYLTPLEGSAGIQTLTLKALFGSKKIEKVLSIAVNQKVTPTGAYQGFASKLSNLSGFDLMTVNIILVIAIVLIFIWIMRVRKAY